MVSNGGHSKCDGHKVFTLYLLGAFFREELTYDLPTLECRMTSSDEDIRSTDDLESTADELDCSNSPEQEYAVTFDLPGLWR